MNSLRVLSATEQVAAHLRKELLSGTWRGLMPGAERLARELNVGRETVDLALQNLESEGLLLNRGRRRGRLIQVPQEELVLPSLRLAILDYDPPAKGDSYMIELLHLLLEAGHSAFFSKKSLMELKMDVPKIARLIRETAADAWIVGAGSRQVLEWFAEQPVPAFALFGRRRGLPIAGVGPNKEPVIAAVVRALVGLGHQRIVMLTRQERRLPQPGAGERAFLGEMAANGIYPSSYNLPEWDDSVRGFHQMLGVLFQLTPPTALIVDDADMVTAALQFCGNCGLRVPLDVSLICTDPHPSFAWCRPTVAHIHWDSAPVLRRVLRWSDNVARGRKDRRQTLTKAEFVEGGTIGPAPGSRTLR